MNGIDVSEHQGDFDFTPYKDGFVIIRGGYGPLTCGQNATLPNATR